MHNYIKLIVFQKKKKKKTTTTTTNSKQTKKFFRVLLTNVFNRKPRFYPIFFIYYLFCNKINKLKPTNHLKI